MIPNNEQCRDERVLKECVCFTCPDYGLADDCDPDCPTLKQHQAIAKAARKEGRYTVLHELKDDLQTRFIPSNNQWSKGRNSGLIECCNIIDESLRQRNGEVKKE